MRWNYERPQVEHTLKLCFNNIKVYVGPFVSHLNVNKTGLFLTSQFDILQLSRKPSVSSQNNPSHVFFM